MGLDDRSHRRHARVTDLNVTPVKQLGKFVMWREVLIYESQYLFTNVGGHIKTKRWIKPDNLPAPLSSRSLGCRGDKRGCTLMPTASEGSVIRWYGLVKFFLVARQGLNPVCDCLRKLLNDVRRVVRLGVDIQEVIVRLLVWPKLSTFEIQVDIKEISVAVQGLDRNTQVTVLEYLDKVFPGLVQPAAGQVYRR